LEIFFLSQKFDLLGHPVPDNHGKVGRDGHVPTPEMAMKITALLAITSNKKAIARKLGLSVYILNTHYLNRGPLKEQQRIALEDSRHRNLLRLETAADAGNVSAMKELEKIYATMEAEQIERDLGERNSPRQAPSKLGKKEIDEQAALDADASLMAEIEEEADGQRLN
jgi:hypothetical protein